MRMMMRLLISAAFAVVAFALSAPALAQSAVAAQVGAVQVDAAQDGVLVRVGGDAEVASTESIATVVVVGGDLSIDGDATTVVVVDGTATLRGASVTTLVVVSGRAVLSEGTVVTGDVWVPDSTMTDDGTTRVNGETVRDVSGYAQAWWVATLLFALGLVSRL